MENQERAKEIANIQVEIMNDFFLLEFFKPVESKIVTLPDGVFQVWGGLIYDNYSTKGGG